VVQPAAPVDGDVGQPVVQARGALSELVEVMGEAVIVGGGGGDGLLAVASCSRESRNSKSWKRGPPHRPPAAPPLTCIDAPAYSRQKSNSPPNTGQSSLKLWSRISCGVGGG
jgi:hypothetical protein